jgi:cell division transport system permease protein
VSLWRAGASAAFSVATIAGALLIFGAFLLALTNLQAMIDSWSSGAEISVYLTDDVTDIERGEIERAIAASTIVQAREYVSKSEGLARFKRQFQDLAAMAASFEDNPFPASFEVRIRPGAAESDELDRLAQQIAQIEGVADVRYDRRWLERLASALTLVRVATVVFAVVLIVGAVLTVSNVVRLAFHARRDEIEIMQLVGAPLSYIRGPFLAEGIVQGGSGGAIALATLGIAYLALRQQYGSALAATLSAGGLHFLSVQHCLVILVGGMLVGGGGGLLATWGLGALREVANEQAQAA